MAGDWIKMRTDLHEDPAVIRMADALGLPEEHVVGCLHRLWSWADGQTRDGEVPGISARWIDRLVGVDGFADSAVAVGWLSVHAKGIQVPRFDRHNGRPAKVRAQAKHRMQLARSRCADSATDREQTRNERREEKRREESKTTTSSCPVPTKRRTEPAAITWSTESGFVGITGEDRDRWRVAYPACDLDRQLAEMDDWLRANPAKARKSAWRRFIGNWLRRSQDRGGDVASVRPKVESFEERRKRETIERLQAAEG